MPPSLQRADFSPSLRFEGHAIVSADGMIAAADGRMPAALRNDADWRQFQQALDGSAMVVLGRLGHANHPNLGRRRRLVFTTSVAGIAPDPDDANTLLFNPAGAALAEALAAVGVAAGAVAITGGTRVFDYFLPLFDAFGLAEVHRLVLPDGRPCFGNGHPRRILAAAGLSPQRFDLIDPDAGVSLARWVR